MITSHRMNERANRVVAELEKKIKSGEATDHERERYHNGMCDILAFEWADEWKQIKAADARASQGSGPDSGVRKVDLLGDKAAPPPLRSKRKGGKSTGGLSRRTSKIPTAYIGGVS